jgi:hypothetical protein
MLQTARFSPLRSGIQKRLLTRRLEIGVVTLVITLIIITCLLSILLLLHSNEVATKGYELRKLQANQRELYLYNQRLQAEVAQKKSLQLVSGDMVVEEYLTPVNHLVIVETDTKLVRE